MFNQALSGMEPCYDPQENAKYFYSKDSQFVVKLFHSEEVLTHHVILLQIIHPQNRMCRLFDWNSNIITYLEISN